MFLCFEMSCFFCSWDVKPCLSDTKSRGRRMEGGLINIESAISTPFTVCWTLLADINHVDMTRRCPSTKLQIVWNFIFARCQNWASSWLAHNNLDLGFTERRQKSNTPLACSCVAPLYSVLYSFFFPLELQFKTLFHTIWNFCWYSPIHMTILEFHKGKSRVWQYCLKLGNIAKNSRLILNCFIFFCPIGNNWDSN